MAGMFIDGKWKTKNEFAYDDGQFKRDESQFRNWLSADGSSCPDGQKAFKQKKADIIFMCPMHARGRTEP